MAGQTPRAGEREGEGEGRNNSASISLPSLALFRSSLLCHILFAAKQAREENRAYMKMVLSAPDTGRRWVSLLGEDQANRGDSLGESGCRWFVPAGVRPPVILHGDVYIAR